MSEIKLTDAAKYYLELDHQKTAFDNLQTKIEKLDPNILKQFAIDFRNAAPKTKSSSASPVVKICDRIKSLGIVLDKSTSDSVYRTNIVGIEGINPDFTRNKDEPDRFNDLFLAIGVNASGAIKVSPPIVGTTEPGIYYTQNLLNPSGAARLKIDFKHQGIWKKGTHKNQPNCLIQIGGPVTIFRDGNKNYSRDDKDLVETGYFGINFHTTSGCPETIGKWGAGCCVVQNKVLFYEFISKYVTQDVNYSLILLDGSKIF